MRTTKETVSEQDEIDRAIGPILFPLRSVPTAGHELARVQLIPDPEDDDPDARLAYVGDPDNAFDSEYMTRALRERLIALGQGVKDRSAWGGNYRLWVKKTWHASPAHLKQHQEGRLADLSLVRRNGDELPNDILDSTLPILAELCAPDQQFGYVKSLLPNERLVHVGMRRETLCRFRDPWAVTTAVTDLAAGWLPFLRRVFSRSESTGLTVNGHSTVLIDGPDIALSPIPLPPMLHREERIGDILLRAAAGRGMSPKADFLTPQDRADCRPTIRLIPSPVADLAFVLRPVEIDALETSLRAYSDNSIRFKANNESLKDVLKRLTEADRLTDDRGKLLGPYQGITFRVHDVLKSQSVTVDTDSDESLADLLPTDATLTRILDLIALAPGVHAQWFWSGPSRIDIVSRPYAEYVGRA